MSGLTVAIAGNPNCGKTTLFNNLTGTRQRVGNWPGVTVERKEGSYRDAGGMIRVIDLPGVYTLGTVPGMESLDEKLARNYLLSGNVDVIINIIDASNLERNLYLTVQLLEMRLPMVVALNMMDTARSRGIRVDADVLAQRLGCPVIPMVASRGERTGELKAAVREAGGKKTAPAATVEYAAGLEKIVAELSPLLEKRAGEAHTDARWLAVRLLEGDDLARNLASGVGEEVLARALPEVEAELGEDVDILVADGRFSFANGLVRAAVRRDGQVNHGTSESIDRIVLNRWLGPVIFLAIMYLLFMFTINLGGAFVDFFSIATGTIFVDGVKALLAAAASPQWLVVLLADGLGGGVRVVATFIPIIGFLYLFLSALEDSGYMARAAFLMDRLMRVVGLPGKSFLPLIVGFGCNVPAIMASRTLDQERDRIMTVLMTPFMSCGARLTVYALFAAAFFPVGGQNVVFALYMIGVGVAIATGLMLKHTILKGETMPFVMELPPYHLPRPRDLVLHTWIRLKSFVFGAGKVIVVVVVILSFLNSFGSDGSFGNKDSNRSALSAIGRAIIPVFEPMGIRADNWPAAVGIFTGVFAKEAVVGTLNALYTDLAEDDAAGGAAPAAKGTAEAFDFWAGLGGAFTSIPVNLAKVASLLTDPLGLGVIDSLKPAAAGEHEVAPSIFGAMVSRFDGTAGAFSYLLFILLYFPCVAALSAVVREIGPRWATFAALWTTGVAYFLAVTVYQAATFAQHPLSSAGWIGALSAVMGATVFALHLTGRGKSAPPLTATAK